MITNKEVFETDIPDDFLTPIPEPVFYPSSDTLGFTTNTIYGLPVFVTDSLPSGVTASYLIDPKDMNLQVMQPTKFVNPPKGKKVTINNTVKTTLTLKMLDDMKKILEDRGGW